MLIMCCHGEVTWQKSMAHSAASSVPTSCSLVPRPHPKKGERDLVNLDHFLGLSSRARWAHAIIAVVIETLDIGVATRGPTIQIYTAGNGT